MFWFIAKFDPYGRVVAGALFAARLAVDTDIPQALRQRGTEQNVVDAQAASVPAARPWRASSDLMARKPSDPARVRARYGGNGCNAQIAVIARRKANLGVTLIIDHNRSKLRRARRSR